MDWDNERWVKLYTRDSVGWKLLSWQARTVVLHLLRKVDAAGVLDVGTDGVYGLAAVLELPLEVVEPGIAQLTTQRGDAPSTVVFSGDAYAIPNFMEAQEARVSDKQRQKMSRERRLARVTKRDTTSRNVTGESRNVTERHVNPVLVRIRREEIRQEEIRSDPPPSSHERAGARGGGRAIPPSTGYDPDSAADRQALALRTYERMSSARQAVGVELGLPPQHPFPAITPAARPQGFRDLLDRIREEGASAPAICDTVVENRTREARSVQSVEWLSERAFRPDPWANMRQPRASFGNGHHPAKGASPTAIAQAELERLRGKERA